MLNVSALGGFFNELCPYALSSLSSANIGYMPWAAYRGSNSGFDQSLLSTTANDVPMPIVTSNSSRIVYTVIRRTRGISLRM